MPYDRLTRYSQIGVNLGVKQQSGRQSRALDLVFVWAICELTCQSMVRIACRYNCVSWCHPVVFAYKYLTSHS